MNAQPLPPIAPSLNLGDIYYILFRHKWKILLCSITGIVAAVVLYRGEVQPYQSEAKLLVRYIISENKSTAPNSNATAKIVADERGTSIMQTETEILSSVDLATEVAKAIGPQRILAKAGGGNELGPAVAAIKDNVRVYVPPNSNVIHVTFQHLDFELVQPVLKEIIAQYLKLHVEAHRAAGMLGDSLSAEADTLRARLAQTEDELRKVTSRAGVISLEGTKEANANQMTSIRREILNLEAELAGRVAVFEDIKKRNEPSPTATAPVESEIPQSVIDQYRGIASRSNRLQGAEQELLLQFRPDSPRVKEIQAQQAEAEAELKKLREEYPTLVKMNLQVPAQTGPAFEANEAASAWLQITAYQAKIKELAAQYDRIRAEAAKLDLMEGGILELRRKKELEETTYRYYANNLEQSRISQTLGTGKVSNISQIQAPSSPFRDRINLKRFGLIGVSGILAGLAWAFLMELYFDRSVRRPVDLQRMLSAPLFLSVPLLKSQGTRLALEAPKGSSSQSTSTQGPNGLITTTLNGAAHYDHHNDRFRPFHETLRDRLIGYFENKNLTHKPKLVAITGLSSDAGVTTTAAGLARSLSETGEGNVLLVDMTLSQGAAQQFAKGSEVCGLDEVLEARSQAHIHENLYVVSETSNSDRLSRNLPQRFTRLIPKLKASDFDYIIFDMPPVSQLSITPRLAGFMDMVLLVIESEKTDRELVQGACGLLAESKAHVGVILNKTRTYVPSRLQQELMNS